MLFFYWVLVFMYLLLLFVYIFATHPVTPSDPLWPVVSPDIPNYEWTPPQQISLPCERHSDCPIDYLCLGQQCIPKYVKGGTCSSETHGEWQSYNYNSALFAICVCLHPELFAQKHFGGDCDQSVACGAHGRHNLMKNICDCDLGYVPGPDLTCVRVPASQLEPCEEDEIPVNPTLSSKGFHSQYVHKLLLSNTKCVKRPCTFDPWSGRPLVKRARYYKPGWGCVCDPRYGLIGIRLENVQNYTQDTEGNNACVSIYKEPLKHPRNNVEMYQYFYLMRRAPITLIQFQNVWRDDVIHVFRERMIGGSTTLTISENWPRNFMQCVLKYLPYNTRRRYCQDTFLGRPTCIENATIENYKYPECKDLEHKTVINLLRFAKPTIYRQLYRYPVCGIQEDDEKEDPLLRGTVVLNPYQLTHENQDYFRSNGLIMYYRGDIQKWYLDSAPPYDMDRYRSVSDQTNVPKIPIVKPIILPYEQLTPFM